tara:strand:- start:343 stop:729 length:387 start_codon:yes stop_codon:yes gene_type:complete
MERYSRNRIDMRYGSPDVIRPNPDLIRRTRENFSRKNIPSPISRPRPSSRPPSPSQLPMPSQRLLTKQNTRSKSPKPIVIQGKNRKWTIKAKRTSTPRTSSATRRRGRGKRKKQPKRNRDKPSRNRKP